MRRADGFEARRISTLQPIAKTLASDLPRCEFSGSAVDLLKAATDLHLPRFFGVFVKGAIETLYERIDQGGPGRQCRIPAVENDGAEFGV